MPVDFSVNQVATNVSDKLAEGAKSAIGAVTGGLGGSMAAGQTAYSSVLNALGSAKSQIMNSNFSPKALSAAVTNFAKALDPASIYKGLPPAKLDVSNPKPTDTRAETQFSEKKMSFPDDLGTFFFQMSFSSFSKKSPIDRVAQVDPLIIQLPLPPNLQESYSVSYKSPNLEVLGGATSELLKEQGAGVVDTAADALLALVARGAQAAGGTAALAAEQKLGATLNPNQAVLFDNMGFRSHSFSFKLYPKTPSESANLRKIIRAIRDRMVPKKLNTQFLGYPDKVDIDVFPLNPYIDKFKTCVIESMSVNYSPNGSAFYGSTLRPVQVDLQLTFKETEIWFRDVTKATSPSPTEPAQRSISSTEGGAATAILTSGGRGQLGSLAAKAAAARAARGGTE